MNRIEYKLKGNEFKLLQYLKTLSKVKTQNEMAQDLHMSIRTIRDNLRNLKDYKVIVFKKADTKKDRGDYPNMYTINDISLWNLEATSTKKLIDELVKQEHERHLKEDYNGVIKGT